MKTILMPKELTAENGAKYLLLGEFFETVKIQCCECCMVDNESRDDCDFCHGSGFGLQNVDVSWTIIKSIYQKIVERYGQESQWQPMETAPRDGTTILGYWEGGEMWPILFKYGEWCTELHFNEYESVENPCLWMPIPEPPEKG